MTTRTQQKLRQRVAALPSKFRPQPMCFDLPPPDMSLSERRKQLTTLLRLERARYDYYQEHEAALMDNNHK